jgi:hypothetical protein
MDNHRRSVFAQDEKMVQNSRDTSKSARWNKSTANRTDFDEPRRDFVGQNRKNFPAEPSRAVHALVLGLVGQ